MGETVSLQASPSARPEPTVPRHSPPLPPSLAPSISPENGMLKTGCVWNLFRKESSIHHSWAISQEAFSKHTGFRKSVFRPLLVTFFFFLHIQAALIFSINSFISESYSICKESAGSSHRPLTQLFPMLTPHIHLVRVS